MAQTLLHPRWITELSRYRFTSVGTIQHRTTGTDSFNDALVTYVDDPALTDLPCYIERRQTRSNDEVRRPDQTVVDNAYDVLIAGYYPTITPLDQLWSGGIGYNILRASTDDPHTHTALVVEIVNNGT